MFSPSAADGGPASATRSRRRQRPKSSESLGQQPKAKRQRLPLTEQTFANPEPQPDMTELKTDKVATLDSKPAAAIDDAHHTPRRELTVRTKKPKHGAGAANKGDGSLVLTSTNAFTVSKLPALPDRIRSDWSGNQHAEIFSSTGYALTLTPAHAIVWPYNATSQSPETFTFTLPSASKPSDPLPVGCLVSPPASSTEPGLVVVMSGSGKVVYWESISSAATFAFIKKDRSGVEHLISGMSSGEKVIAITNAESAGFILTFSTGRLAYMSVRDGHGRPAVSVQFLRTGLVSSGSGIFGSIRHAFSHLSLRGDVAAVRADRSTRVGERNIVALTSKGKLQSWAVHRGGHHEPTGEADVRERLVAALQETDRTSQEFSADTFEALDFTFVPKGLERKYLALSRLSDAMASDNPNVQHLLLLVSLTRGSGSRYALVEVILNPNDCQIGMIRPITSYSAPLTQADSTQSVRPRIYLPRPALVAFVVLDHAAIIASVATPPESPESQLQTDSHILPASFEDVVDFREDNVHEVVGSGFEETPAIPCGHEENRAFRHKTKNPAVVLMVRGAGVVRIVTTDVDKFASDQPPRVSAKSKLEQAVFFGIKNDNPLVFDGRQEFDFSSDEIAKAALEISHEILCSSTPYISTLPASLEENMRARSSALERLMLHLKAIGADLDRNTRWKLLFNAEKMHVAILLWRRHEAFTATRPTDDKKSLVGSIIEFIQEGHHNHPNKSIGEVDAVRHWFTNDIYRLELFVTWAYEVIKVQYKDKLLNDVQMTIALHEAMHVNIITHTGALDFRKNNLALYGLGQEQLRMGILRDGYEGLPEPWTGCMYVANNAKRLADLCGQWFNKYDQLRKSDPGLIAKIYDDIPALIDGMLTSVLEYARWGTANSERKTLPQEFVKTYDAERHARPVSLAHLGKWEQAAKIAEKHGCLSALAVILLEHVDTLEHRMDEPDLSEAELTNLRNLRQAKKTQLEDSLGKYGEPFAFPVYECLLAKHGVAAVMDFELDTLGFKTRFLRSRRGLARISWINDVQQEKDVGHAAITLMNLALSGENHVWKKNIELSLSKLALLAEAEDQPQPQHPFTVKSDDDYGVRQLEKVDNELIVVRIQNHLYSQVLPSTYDAVDSAAALNFALEAHSTNVPRRQKALLQLFTDGMAKLLDHQALDPMYLIDLLTLVALGPQSREEIAHPFWMALKVAETACHADEAKDAKKLIWRRLFIRDDWAKINDTQLKDDVEVVNRVADTELFAMFTDCIRFQNPQSPFRPMEPQESLGVFTETLDRRFQNFAESEQVKLVEAMRWEDKVLTQYIEKNRLAQWVRSAYDTAQTEVESIAEDNVRGGGPAVDARERTPLFGRRRSSAADHAASLLGSA
ncbi:nuclear pore complex subunit [Ophiocordyceps sinensis CO18]|uniref:Nuclear pore complex subunit n=1 Tax=Ophiocordyceps sinensis (strain Co18 / CGMCC 3.14243) TaxID=911162 RepID=T5APV8_OPHSC|nr:nuclear pore complex subunit [Ophiocordyceps sinensis CO18]